MDSEFIENQDATIDHLQKKILQLKTRQSLAEKYVVEKYKALEDFHEAMEQTASLYYGKGFELWKK